MPRIILFISAFLLVIAAKSQVKFQKSHGGQVEDSALDLIVDNNGDYLYCGYTASYGAGDKDMYFVKTDTDGDTIFVRTFGGSSVDDGAMLKQTADNGYIIVGTTESYGAGNSDIFLVKTDVNGNLQWSKTYGTNLTDLGYGVEQTTDGGYIISGATFTVTNGYEIVAMKTDAAGDTTWTTRLGSTNSINDIGYEIIEVTGGYVLAGFSIHTFPANENVFVAKLNTNGTLDWSKKWGGNGNDYGYAITQTTDGGLAVAGVTNSFGAGDYDMWVLKLNQSGDTLWHKAFGSTGADFAQTIVEDTDGGLLISGYTDGYNSVQNDGIVIKIDASGNFVWGKTFGEGGVGYEEARGVRPLPDKGCIIAGYTDSYGQGQGDAYLVRIDSLQLAGCSENNITPVITSGSINVASTIVVASTGYSVQSISPIWGAQNTVVETICYCDGQLALADYTTSDNGLTIDFTDQSSGSPTNWDWDFGDSNNSTQQNPSHTYASPGTYYVCLTVTNNCGSNTYCDSVTVDSLLNVGSHFLDEEMRIYPNPAKDNFTIKSDTEIIKLELFNTLGENLYQHKLNGSKNVIVELPSISSGVYIVNISTDSHKYVQKLIIE